MNTIPVQYSKQFLLHEEVSANTMKDLLKGRYFLSQEENFYHTNNQMSIAVVHRNHVPEKEKICFDNNEIMLMIEHYFDN